MLVVIGFMSNVKETTMQFSIILTKYILAVEILVSGLKLAMRKV